MGRGLGETQRKILAYVDDPDGDEWAYTIAEISRAVGIGPTQTRAAVHALERRGLVILTRECIGWRRDVGALTIRKPCEGAEPEYVLKQGDPLPAPQWDPSWARASRDIVLYRRGTPIAGLLVWGRENRAEWERNREQTLARIQDAIAEAREIAASL